MTQATLNRILKEIKTLKPSDIELLEHTLRERREADSYGYSVEEWRVQKALVEAGLMQKITPRCTESVLEFTPVPILGKPLSETIIEERR